MTNARFSFKSILSNVRLLGTALVLIVAIGMLLVQKTESTGAFLSSKNLIKMGVGTDKWAPPESPTILGYTAVAADPTTPFTTCEVMTGQDQVVIHWQNTAADLKTIANYQVGTVADPVMATYSNKVTQATFALAEGINELQVVALDKRGTPSEPAFCVVSADRVAPIVELTQPTATLSGKTVSMAATISELNLGTAQFEVKNSSNELVATGGALTVSQSDASQQTLSYTWDAATFESGEYSLTAVATDVVGHRTSSQKLISLDTQAPVSTLTMSVPVASTSGLLSNGSFEAGLTNWTIQGDVQLADSSFAIKPQQGSKTAVLGAAGTANQVSLVSKDLSAVANQVQTVGFWYNLNPSHGVSNTEGMMVFIGNELVHQEWLANQSAGWRYLQLNVAGVADPTVTVTYSHDADDSTGGELYLDGFTTNHTFSIDQLSFYLTGADNVGQPVVHASYLVSGQEVALSNLASLSFALPVVPDDTKISYWSVDSLGNRESVQTLSVPTLISLSATPEEVEPSPSASPSPTPAPSDEPATQSASLAPVVTIADKGAYKFDFSITNVLPSQQVAYVIAYKHGEISDQITDAIQGAGTVATDATQILVNNLYFGTCSSTAGVVCTPHTGVADIEIILTVTDPTSTVVTEYHYAYPGTWTTESTNEAV